MNLFLGMCKGAEGLPRDLNRLGYVDRCIEFGFTNARNEAVVPELIIASNTLGHSILFEWKEGPNTDQDQLNRYAGITADDLRQKVFLTERESASHNTTVIGLAEHEQRVVIGVERGGHNFPVLLACPEGLRKVRNRFIPSETETLFHPRLEFDWNLVPTFLYPLDLDSTLAEYAELILPTLLERMGAGATRLLLTEIAASIIPVWNIVDLAYQGRLRQKILAIMDRAVRHEFAQFLRRNQPAERRTHTPTWDIIDNPISNMADRGAQAWRQMRTRAQSLIEFFGGAALQQDLPLREDENDSDP